MTRQCLDCEKLLTGRSDKRFCDDYCRNHHYNQLHRHDISFSKQVNLILRKNKLILKKFHTHGILRITRESLLVLGFNFAYFTHQDDHNKPGIYTFCYEYGYLKLNDNEYLIHKSDA